jgi:hypothetical protein
VQEDAGAEGGGVQISNKDTKKAVILGQPEVHSNISEQHLKRGGRPCPAGHMSRQRMMCSQGRSRADEGTAGRVTSECHQGQVESV